MPTPQCHRPDFPNQTSQKLLRQETPNSVGGKKSMYQIQARAAMEQQQIRSDLSAIAAAGPSI